MDPKPIGAPGTPAPAAPASTPAATRSLEEINKTPVAKLTAAELELAISNLPSCVAAAADRKANRPFRAAFNQTICDRVALSLRHPVASALAAAPLSGVPRP